jgi:SAM-dependent methyltransferase
MADKPPVALEDRGEGGDGRRYSPSAARNREPIRDALKAHLSMPARVLEIASGTGEHGAFLVSELPGVEWTYSDIDPPSLESQRAWKAAAQSERLHGPLEINAAQSDWGEAEQMGAWDAIFSANMVHIAPFEAAEGLITGAGRLLKPGGMLVLYGPFARNGVIAPSNAAFHESLKSRDVRWGVRDLDLDLAPLAGKVGLRLAKVIEMPANNLMVVFQKT